MPVVALTRAIPRTIGLVANVEEVRARSGRVIAIAHEGHRDRPRAHHVIAVPPSTDLLRR